MISITISTFSVSVCELTDTYSLAAIDNASANNLTHLQEI